MATEVLTIHLEDNGSIEGKYHPDVDDADTTRLSRSCPMETILKADIIQSHFLAKTAPRNPEQGPVEMIFLT